MENGSAITAFLKVITQASQAFHGPSDAGWEMTMVSSAESEKWVHFHFHVWRSRNGRAIKEGDGSLPQFGAISVHLPAHLGWNTTSTAEENVSSQDLKKCDGVLLLRSRED